MSTPSKFDISLVLALIVSAASVACDKTAEAVQPAPNAPTPPAVSTVADPQRAAPVSPAVSGASEHPMPPGMKMGPGMEGHDHQSDGGHGGTHGGHSGAHGGHGGMHS